MAYERAMEILQAWELLSEPKEKATPERVAALTGASWDEWTAAHQIVFPDLYPNGFETHEPW